MSAKVQRLRVTYARGAPLQYVSHLDMMRFWERVLRRANAPVSYSEGFTPHAQIALAAPLSVGMTSRGELLDIFLAEVWPPERLRAALGTQLPPGVVIIDVREAELAEPSLQSQVRAAEYAIALRSDADRAAIAGRLAAFCGAATFPWEHQREKETKRYDLRPLVLDLRLEERPDGPVVVATLRAEETGTARPDQVVAALALTDDVLHIERLALKLGAPAARP